MHGQKHPILQQYFWRLHITILSSVTAAAYHFRLFLISYIHCGICLLVDKFVLTKDLPTLINNLFNLLAVISQSLSHKKIFDVNRGSFFESLSLLLHGLFNVQYEDKNKYAKIQLHISKSNGMAMLWLHVIRLIITHIVLQNILGDAWCSTLFQMYNKIRGHVKLPRTSA